MAFPDEKPVNTHYHRFNTFGGVFTPAILTILGVIMFMRANFVVGQAGILGAILILVIAKSITFSTSLSIAAISTNIRVRGGGSYFLISRVLGPEFGGAIGIALFFALALSVPFYILGFAEALVITYPDLAPYFRTITMGMALTLFFIAYYGAGLAIKAQYVIMVVLVLSIITFLGGALQDFSLATFQQNLRPSYTVVDLAGGGSLQMFSFWVVFAIYFPAVTGIDAGVNMSGDLKDPHRSIPRGTFGAVGLGFAVYLLQILIGGGAWEREAMVAQPFELLRNNALGGAAILVTLGVVAATLSSALSSYLGAPRVLQAVSRDRILKFLTVFGRGSAKGNEPRRALALTFFITVVVLLWAGNGAGGGALNVVAAIITMFFLYSYGMINLAAFIEDYGDNPSFRPSFKYFHWSFALFGAAGCAFVSFLINWLAALAAVLIIVLLLWYIRTRHLQAAFGDARRGFLYTNVRENLLRLSRSVEDPKNWRPTVLVFSGNPEAREPLVRFAVWFAAKRGLVYLASVLIGEFNELAPRRDGAVAQLKKYCHENNMEAFPVVVAADTLEQGVTMLMQSTTIGPIRPNLAVLGWTNKSSHLESFMRQLRASAALGMSIILLVDKKLPDLHDGREKRIDIWWRGHKNGDLMILMAFLLTENWEWEHTSIRIIRVVESDEGCQPAWKALNGLISLARVQATAKVIVTSEPFEKILADNSHDATCAILGFEIPETDEEIQWFNRFKSTFKGVDNVILVNSQGGEKLVV